MNMFAMFDENPAMTLQDIKETKRYGRTHARTDNVKTVYPPQTKFAGGGGIIILIAFFTTIADKLVQNFPLGKKNVKSVIRHY